MAVDAAMPDDSALAASIPQEPGGWRSLLFWLSSPGVSRTATGCVQLEAVMSVPHDALGRDGPVAGLRPGALLYVIRALR